MTTAAGGHPRLILVTAFRWLHTAHLALAAREAGFDVCLVAPAGHPLERLAWVTPLGIVSAIRPAHSVARALDRAGEGAVVVPVDDVSATAVFDAARGRLLGAVAEASVARSLGRPDTFRIRGERVTTAAVARDVGVDVPRTRGVASVSQLAAVLDDVGLPAVLKTDRSSGSQGVVLVRDRAQAEDALRRLGRRPSVVRGLARWWRDDDATYVAPGLSRTAPVVSAQSFVPGTPATVTVACWEGEVLGEVPLRVVGPVAFGGGPATLVEPVAAGEMREAARAVVKALGLSGLCGLDFHARPDGRVTFLELNPRATPTAHLPTTSGESLLDLLAPGFGAVPQARPRRAAPTSPVALYPQERVRDAASPWAGTDHEDVPADAPDVVALVTAALATPVPSVPARLGRWRAARRSLRRAAEG